MEIMQLSRSVEWSHIDTIGTQAWVMQQVLSKHQFIMRKRGHYKYLV